MQWRSCRLLEVLGGGVPDPWEERQCRQPEAPGLPETKPSIKGYTWFQPKEWQRNALSGISGRRGPWSCEGSIEAPVWGNRVGAVGVGWVEEHILGDREWENGLGVFIEGGNQKWV